MGGGGGCEDECARNTLPLLPVLTAENAQSERAWHNYIRAVYHQDITHGMSIDLNTFGWFWTNEGPNYEAVRTMLATPCLQVCSLGVASMVYEGTPWRGDIGPEDVRPMHGVFIARPFLLPETIPTCDRIEVAHRSNPDWAGAEVGVSWFFHAPGSGIFLSCHNLPRANEGRHIAAYVRRTDSGVGDWPNPEGGTGLSNYMDYYHLSMLVFTEADYSIQRNVLGLNPRTEIIVRQAQDAPPSDWYGGHSEDGLPHRSCLTDPAIGLTFTTGLGGTLPCGCSPKSYLNCEATASG